MRKRKQPEAPPPKVEVQKQEGIITQEREYKLITPLFGGGAVTGAPDEVTVIRGTEIRGHLRFWWRACYGGRYQTVAEIKAAEDLLWGAATTSEQEKESEKKGNGEDGKKDDTKPKKITVQIMVDPIQADNIEEILAFRIGKNGQPVPDLSLPGYAAFPLQPTDERPAKSVYKKVRFCLTISFPEARKKELEGALWAWETFGGIGARTRRGFGAIQLQKIVLIEYTQQGKSEQEVSIELLPDATVPDVRKWLTEKFAYFGIDKKAPGGVPSLSKNMLEQLYVMPPSSDVKEAWKKLIDRFRMFRQPGRGHNKWLDTREIKRLRDTINPSSEQEYTLPKAVLGLPIVFHFADKGKDGDLTLEGAEQGHDRLASSLILRPLACRSRNDQETEEIHQNAVGLVLLLENHDLPPGNLQVVTKEPKVIPATIKTQVSSTKASDTALKGETDVLKALMDHMKRKKIKRETTDK